MILPAHVVVFDLDDTLALSKSKITPRIAQGLTDLLSQVEVCIISGGRLEQFQTQVLDELTLPPKLAERLHLMPTCGTRYLRWESDDWCEVYAETLSAQERALVTKVLTEGATELGLWESQTWGEIIEDRGSQVTFSALGQQAPPEVKAAWDPDGAKRGVLRAYAAERLPGLEVRSGGSTSIDVTRQGIDKGYGMRKLMSHLGVGIDDVLFFGDRLDDGGNDFPVRAMGVRCVAVTGWEQTADYIERLLSADPAVEAPPVMDAVKV